MIRVITFFVMILLMGTATAAETILVCEGELSCPKGCWGSESDLTLDLKGKVVVKQDSVEMAFEPLWGTWKISKRSESAIYFETVRGDEGVLEGKLDRYTGDLIAYNRGAFEEQGALTKLKVYAKMACKPADKLF